MDNLELFELVELETGSDGAELAQDVVRFIAGLGQLWRGTSERSLLIVDALQEIGQALDTFSAGLRPGGERFPRMWSSFDRPATDLLKVRTDRGTLYVAAPYFGGATAGLTALQEVVQPKATHVYPAIHDGGTLDLPGVRGRT